MAINTANWSVKGEAYAYRLPTNATARSFTPFILTNNNIPADILAALKADGGDLRICKDLAGTQQLPLDMFLFDKNGETKLFGRYDNPTVGSLANNIYFFAGNAAANLLPTTDQFSNAGVYATYEMATHDLNPDNDANTERTGKTFTTSGNGIARFTGSLPLPNGMIGASISPTPGDMLEVDVADLRDYTMVIWHNYRARPSSTAGAALLEISEQSGSTGSYITHDYEDNSNPVKRDLGGFNSSNAAWLRGEHIPVLDTWEMYVLTGNNSTTNERALFVEGVEVARGALTQESTARTRLRMGNRQTGSTYRADCGLALAYYFEGDVDEAFVLDMKNAYDDPDNFFLPLNNTETLTLTISSNGTTFDAGDAVNLLSAVDSPDGARTYTYLWDDAVATAANNFLAPNLDVAATLTKTCQVTDDLGNTSPPTDIVLNINEGLVASAGNNQEIEIGSQFTLTGSATGGSGNYTFLWSVEAGIATLSDNTAASPTGSVINTVVFGLVVSDGNITTDKVFITVKAQDTVTPDYLPNFTPKATQGLASDSLGIFCSNSDTAIHGGAADGIIKYGYDGTVLATNNNLYANLPNPSDWKSNCIVFDPLTNEIYGVPTDQVNNTRRLVVWDSTTLAHKANYLLSHTGFSAGLCIGHTGNLFLCTHVTPPENEGDQIAENAYRFLEITKSGVQVQYWVTNWPVFKTQGIEWTGTQYITTSNNELGNFPDNSFNYFEPKTAPKMWHVKQSFINESNLTEEYGTGNIFELEGLTVTPSDAPIAVRGKVLSHDINGRPFVVQSLDVDITSPVITLLGTSPATVTQNTTYTDAGATASDNVDGDITADIVVVNPVNTATLGAYTVTYNVDDAAGNSATQVTRTVNVEAAVDTTAPVITVSGNATTTITVGDTAPTFTASTDDGSTIVVGGDTVDANTVGTYIITFNATDEAGNQATEVTRTVIVLAEGQAAPVITVSTTGTIILVKDTYFETPTSEVNDPSNPDAEATVTSTLNASEPGPYTITYSYEGATSVVVNILVVEGITVPPQRQITVH